MAAMPKFAAMPLNKKVRRANLGGWIHSCADSGKQRRDRRDASAETEAHRDKGVASISVLSYVCLLPGVPPVSTTTASPDSSASGRASVPGFTDPGGDLARCAGIPFVLPSLTRVPLCAVDPRDDVRRACRQRAKVTTAHTPPLSGFDASRKRKRPEPPSAGFDFKVHRVPYNPEPKRIKQV
jgi:hypothetical protein